MTDQIFNPEQLNTPEAPRRRFGVLIEAVAGINRVISAPVPEILPTPQQVENSVPFDIKQHGTEIVMDTASAPTDEERDSQHVTQARQAVIDARPTPSNLGVN